MREVRSALALAAAALFAGAAAGQQGAPNPFKGKVKPGLYETKTDADMGNMPGVPADKKEQSSSKRHCISPAEIDKLAEESNPSCKTTNLKASATGASFRVTCTGNGEMISDVVMAFQAAGFVTESKVTMKPAGGGTSISLSQRAQSKYLGDCPREAPKK